MIQHGDQYSRNMKTQIKTICLDRAGVDTASEVIQSWLEAVGIQQRDILRIRLSMEELLGSISSHEENVQAEMRLKKRIGDWQLLIRYDGDRFDPTAPKKTEIDEWTADLLARTGIVPIWRWRTGKNELLLRIPYKKSRPERIMFGCMIAAIVVGVLGQYLPEAVKTGITDYCLAFLSDGFLHLLGTFIGLVIFLSIITGICGIGSSTALGRIGKLMISRFVCSTLITCAVHVLIVRVCFPLSHGAGGGGSQLYTVVKMVFDIIPTNPIRPFLEGNTLQIVFLATMVGAVLLMTGSETEGIRRLFFQADILLRRCVSGVCMLLPVFIFSSLVMLFWKNGTRILLQFWKPLVVCTGISLVLICGYLTTVCRRFKVKAKVLLRKLMPDFLIALSTSSAAVAMPTGIEINETKLGIDASFSRTALPIGNILFAGSFSILYVITGAFMAQYYGLVVDVSWWIILWLVCSLLSMATPPVAGGMISCLSVLLLQLGIPSEGVALAASLTILLDLIGTATRVMLLHLELIMQADRLELLDHEVLRS